MPELPEVETIKRSLKPMQGQTIAKVELKLKRLLLGTSPAVFRRSLVGQNIQKLIRRGKYLVLELTEGALVVHLGMTGQITLATQGKGPTTGFKKTVTGLQVARGIHPVDKHTHLIVTFISGDRFLYRDVRTFGKLIYCGDGDWKSHPRIQKLGREPLGLNPEKFLAGHWPISSIRPIKSMLLDQSFICGLGNIYSDEALFLSGVHPESPAKTLSESQWILLLKMAKKVLNKGIRNNGTTFSDYQKPDGSPGSNQEKLKVYGRGGKDCYQCGGILQKIVVAQRGTVFCPECQSVA